MLFRSFALKAGDQVKIRRSPYSTDLIRLTEKSVFDILRTKLMGEANHEE